MATVIPFHALRFTEKAGALHTLVCPPYDIISEPQRQRYLAQNPKNIIRLELPRDGGEPYAAAGDTLREWLQDGILAADQSAAFYIYAIDFTVDGVKKQIAGLVGRVGLAEFSEGIVLPHEETLSKAKANRLELMRATGCNFSDIYSLYNAPNDSSHIHHVQNLTAHAALLQELTDEDGLVHRLWAVTDPAVTAAISAAFEGQKLYIADGHHRYETALNYRRELRASGNAAPGADYCMMMLVEMEHPGLWVFPTHRILHHLPDFSAERLFAACEIDFDIRPTEPSALAAGLRTAYAAHQKAFGFFDGHTAALLTLRDTAVMDTLLPTLSPVSRQLDVTVLHTLILDRLLQIDRENMANQTNLRYTRDIKEALAAPQTGGADCCFLLNPTRVSEIRDVAAAGEKMPQKSTYFYPKLITGLTVNQIL